MKWAIGIVLVIFASLILPHEDRETGSVWDKARYVIAFILLTLGGMTCAGLGSSFPDLCYIVGP